jgi:Family of unknown function (DUF6516)
MPAQLIHREKHVPSDGSLVEMVIWRLPRKTCDRQHGIKYRLYYGLPNGRCVIRYDNESGKGDHRHYKSREMPYRFIDAETFIRDFLADVEQARRPAS